MADNLKPYDPNKGFISFRLNPEAIKEELISFVPYNRTLRHIYNNPEGDIRETAKVAASETPILGSLLAGEPTNAVQEAFLLGMPVKNTKALNKLKPGTEFGLVNGYGNEMILAKEPGARKTKAFGINSETGKLERYTSYDGETFGSPTVNRQELDEFIKNSNKLHSMQDEIRFNPNKTPVGAANADLGYPRYVEDLEGTTNVVFDNDFTGPLGHKYQDYSEIQRIINEAETAKPKGNEQVKWVVSRDPYTGELRDNYVSKVRLYNPKTGKYRTLGGRDTYNLPDAYPIDIPDKKIHERDMKLLKNELEAQRNANSMFSRYSDDIIDLDMSNPDKYIDDYHNAYQMYKNALYGPYYQDILNPTNQRYGINRDEWK